MVRVAEGRVIVGVAVDVFSERASVANFSTCLELYSCISVWAVSAQPTFQLMKF